MRRYENTAKTNGSNFASVVHLKCMIMQIPAKRTLNILSNEKNLMMKLNLIERMSMMARNIYN